MTTYNVCMFAYNEEKNIEKSIASVKAQCSEHLNKLYLMANGCKDRTVEIAKTIQASGFDKLEVVEIEMGDKCNAWNLYMHEVGSEADVHFFVDADVQFSNQCFEQMARHLAVTPAQTVTIAGLPLSGRNRAFYERLVKERSCFFGNLYGLKQSFIDRIRSASFRLPVGLNWIDSFLTKAVNTDLSFGPDNLPQRVTYLEGVGYTFDKLSPFSVDEIKLYINRIARYELGKIQEVYLDTLPFTEWPSSMLPINEQIEKNFERDSSGLSWIKKKMVRKRLTKLLKVAQKQQLA